MKKVILTNWTTRSQRAGGAETVYEYLSKVFPNNEIISGTSLFPNEESPEDLIKKIDDVLLQKYNENKNIFLIRDAEFGGYKDISEIPQVLIFGNPYKPINEQVFKNVGVDYTFYKPWIFECYKHMNYGVHVATSNFMKDWMEKEGIKCDHVIPNCVDTDIFKPLNDKTNLRKKYFMPLDKKIGIFIGSDNPVKNFQMIVTLMSCFSEITWIMVTKDYFARPFDNVLVFYNIPQIKINELLNCADFFILTSPIEGCGIAMLEAMSSGVPCIISKSGYFWDYWDPKIGIQVDHDSFEQHAEAVININKIKTDPRSIIFERGLDYESWKKKWEKLINE